VCRPSSATNYGLEVVVESGGEKGGGEHLFFCAESVGMRDEWMFYIQMACTAPANN
jgi:hypothetical protein